MHDLCVFNLRGLSISTSNQLQYLRRNNIYEIFSHQGLSKIMFQPFTSDTSLNRL